MTSKDYFRNLALHDLGFPADDKVLELHDYITERLSNLNQYTSDVYPDYIFYGKSKDELIINYKFESEHINLYNNQFIKKLVEHFGLRSTDILEIISNSVVYILQIKVKSNDIYLSRHSGFIDNLQIKNTI